MVRDKRVCRPLGMTLSAMNGHLAHAGEQGCNGSPVGRLRPVSVPTPAFQGWDSPTETTTS